MLVRPLSKAYKSNSSLTEVHGTDLAGEAKVENRQANCPAFYDIERNPWAEDPFLRSNVSSPVNHVGSGLVQEPVEPLAPI